MNGDYDEMSHSLTQEKLPLPLLISIAYIKIICNYVYYLVYWYESLWLKLWPEVTTVCHIAEVLVIQT